MVTTSFDSCRTDYLLVTSNLRSATVAFTTELDTLIPYLLLPIHVKYRVMYMLSLDTKAKVLLKFGGLETLWVDRRSKKLLELPHYRYM